MFGLLKRNGTVRAFPIPVRDKEHVLDLLTENTRSGSLYFIDEWRAYTSLSVRGEHVVVRKDRRKPKGRDHINGIEGFCSYAKHCLYQYRGVAQKIIPIYLSERCFRFKYRDEDLYT